MSDNRPPVYFDPTIDKWVFRFSSLGNCEKALVAHTIPRYQTLAEPTPQWLQVKYDEGITAESIILKRWAEGAGGDGYKWHLEDPADLKAYRGLRWIVGGHDNQFLAEIPVGRKAIIRGHPDGIGQLYQASVGSEWIPGRDMRVGVEVKAFGKTYWERFIDKGLNGFR